MFPTPAERSVLGQLAVLTRAPPYLGVRKLPEWVRAELGHEPGREGRRGAPALGSRCGPATGRPATSPGGPGVAVGLPSRRSQAQRQRPSPGGRARNPAGARGRLLPALSGPKISPTTAAPELGAGASACRTGGRLRAPPAGARPRPAPPRGGPLTPSDLGWFRPGVTSAGARSRRDCAGRAAFRAAAAGVPGNCH